LNKSIFQWALFTSLLVAGASAQAHDLAYIYSGANPNQQYTGLAFKTDGHFAKLETGEVGNQTYWTGYGVQTMPVINNWAALQFGLGITNVVEPEDDVIDMDGLIAQGGIEFRYGNWLAIHTLVERNFFGPDISAVKIGLSLGI